MRSVAHLETHPDAYRRTAVAICHLMETSPESSERSGRGVSSSPAEGRPAGAGRIAPRGQGLCLGTLVRLGCCRVRLAVPTRRRRCGICTELCPCNAAVGHQRIPALPTRHGKECVLAVDACAKCPGRSDAKRRRCGAPRVGDHLLRGVLPIPRHVRGGLRIGRAHSRLGHDDGGRLRSALPRGGARVGLLSG